MLQQKDQPNPRFVVVLTATMMLHSFSFSLADERKAVDAQASLDGKIADLIAGLGADEFATREKAQAELERLGLVAFDALHEAQYHNDIEIAMRARYLVRSMRFNWSVEDDPGEVKRILRSYGAQNDGERKTRMENLAELDDSRGITALCRLVRFETSMQLSKQAALLVLNHDAPEEEAQRELLAQAIKATIGLSKRPSAQWLKTYAGTLLEPERELDNWSTLTAAEQETFTKFPERSSREIVRDLLRWQAELLRRLDRQQQALAVMKRCIDLLDGTGEQILDMVDWLMERKAWSVVNDVAERYSTTFEQNSLLLYRLAEAEVQQGHREQAEAIADRALQVLSDEPLPHKVAAFSLQDRGLLEWAEREYRHVMKIGPPGSFDDVHARLLLSEMLHDVLKELPAAEVLQGAVDALEKDQAAVEMLRNRLGRELGPVKSRMHYFYSQHYAAIDDRMKEIEHLEKAVKSDPTDADVLIAMFHTANPDDQWRQDTVKKIETAKGHFRDQIAEFERQVAQAPSEPLREWASRQLASANNQFAWLVGNTVGDYDEAIRCSNKSLELRPDTGGYLDTLGRCYYAKGDFANAVAYQHRAVQLEPHSQQIRRQLKLFEQALANAKQGGDTEVERAANPAPAKDELNR